MTIRVLIIDDEPIYSKSIALYLGSEVFDIALEYSGKAGLNYLAKHPDTDLVLLDLMMPDMYGIDVLEAIKNSATLKHIPVILQTGMVNETEIIRGMNAGAADCLRKPFKRQKLLDTVRRLTSGNNAPVPLSATSA